MIFISDFPNYWEAPTTARRRAGFLLEAQGLGQKISLFHNLPSPLHGSARMPTNDWHVMVAAKAPSQSWFAVLDFCSDKASWQWEPPTWGQFLTDGAGKSQVRNLQISVGSHSAMLEDNVPLVPSVEADNPEGSQRFPLVPDLPDSLPPHPGAAFLLLWAGCVEAGGWEVARDAHWWPRDKWRRRASPSQEPTQRTS